MTLLQLGQTIVSGSSVFLHLGHLINISYKPDTQGLSYFFIDVSLRL